jgi:hypothetical protein
LFSFPATDISKSVPEIVDYIQDKTVLRLKDETYNCFQREIVYL